MWLVNGGLGVLERKEGEEKFRIWGRNGEEMGFPCFKTRWLTKVKASDRSGIFSDRSDPHPKFLCHSLIDQGFPLIDQRCNFFHRFSLFLYKAHNFAKLLAILPETLKNKNTYYIQATYAG